MADETNNRRVEPFVMVIFGASGDLTGRKLMPAIFRLWQQGLLGETFAVVGFARSEMADETFRQGLMESMTDSSLLEGETIDRAAWETFASHLHYHRGDYDSQADYKALARKVNSLGGPGQAEANCLFYLATPPGAFETVISHLNQAGLARRGQDSPWSRLVIEKPFGRDQDSAQQLNAAALGAFEEGQVFRIDHYLGKETVQNILVLRFANSIFEHLWGHDNIDHVQITVSESLGVGSRGSYYDQAGALRDMVQNHMMHLLSLIAMEPPVSLTAQAIRNEKEKVLRSLRPIPPACAANGVVRGQYAAGALAGKSIAAYRSTPGVGPNSGTETFVAFKAYIDNWRWAAVPFYLRTGKCLPRRCTEISIHFKDVPQVLFNKPPASPLRANVLAIRVQPEEGISLEFQAKAPGPAMNIQPLRMDFDYEKSFGTTPPDAYERLLLDAVMGDATLFTRSDEVLLAWRFVMPIISGCSQSRAENLHEYPAGSWGPAAAEELIRADGREWHLR